MGWWRNRARPRETIWVADVALAVASAALGIGYVGRDGEDLLGWGWLGLAVGWGARAVLERRQWRAHLASRDDPERGAP
jgi:hypothetical protein